MLLAQLEALIAAGVARGAWTRSQALRLVREAGLAHLEAVKRS